MPKLPMSFCPSPLLLLITLNNLPDFLLIAGEIKTVLPYFGLSMVKNRNIFGFPKHLFIIFYTFESKLIKRLRWEGFLRVGNQVSLNVFFNDLKRTKSS